MEEGKDHSEFIKSLCQYCFANLENFLEIQEPLSYNKEFDSHSFPLFVTWHFDHKLRGCIGTFKADKLGKNLQEYSLIAAFKDSRFPPIQKKELPHLSVDVSLLSHFEDIQNPLDWEVGKHGIEIEFTDEKGRLYRGTYLP